MLSFVFILTGLGESDAHCWAEATHAAEGFSRHLKLRRYCKAPASSLLVSCRCFLPWSRLSAVILIPPSASVHSPIGLFPSLPSFHSRNAAGSQNGTIVSALPLLMFTSITCFAFTPSRSLWLHVQVFRSDHRGHSLRFGHVAFWKRRVRRSTLFCYCRMITGEKALEEVKMEVCSAD